MARTIWLRTPPGLLLVLLLGANVRAADRPAELKLSLGGTEAMFRLIQPHAEGLEYPDFYLLETEVTNKQYQQFLLDTMRTKDDSEVLRIVQERRGVVSTTGDGATVLAFQVSTADVPYSVEDPASIWKNGQFPAGQDAFPVALVTLPDAQEFCKWLSAKHPEQGLFRLPTANEWLVAAYGGKRQYPWGDDWDKSKCHTAYGCNSATAPKRTEDVRARPLGKTPQGLFGMIGNVSEYIHDADPTGTDYFDLGARWMGGGFHDGIRFFSDDRKECLPREDYWGYSHHATLQECDLGFRVLLDPSKDLSLLKRPRLFRQRNQNWRMTED